MLWLTVFLLTLVLAAEVALALFTSPRFAIQQIRVEGAGPLSVPLITGQAAVRLGSNLFSFPTKQTARRVKAISSVGSVRIKKLPPRTLLISVTERRPVARLSLPWGSGLLDPAGLFFVRPGPAPEGLPELQGLSLSPQAVGHPLKGAKAVALRKGLAALAQNPYFKVKILAVDARGWLTAHLASGTELRLGEATQLPGKLALAQEALSRVKGTQTAEYVDVCAPEAIVWKPRR